MTTIASTFYLFFLLHLMMLAPPHHAHRPSQAGHRKQAPAQAQVHQPQNVSAPQPISSTKPISPTKQATDQSNRADLYHRVAARSLGEGPSAIAEIACTVKNRLRVSGSPLRVVLRAYFAHDRPPKPEHIEIVRKVFEGELPCPETWWYALSPEDTRRFRPHRHPVLMVKRDPLDQIWIYDR